MAQRSRFFDSITGDRIYSFDEVSDLFASLISDGYLTDFKNELRVSESVPPAMSVLVRPGMAWILGRTIEVYDDPVELVIDDSDTSNSRIDRIIAHLSFTNREITIQVKKGVPATNPQPPVLQRDSLVYEISLAQVRVNANATSVVNANITSERDNPSVCGKAELFEHDFQHLFVALNGLSQMTGPLDLRGVPSSSSALVIRLPQNYTIFADNTGPGTSPNRFWLSGPDGGSAYIGPRSGGQLFDEVHLRSRHTRAHGSLRSEGETYAVGGVRDERIKSAQVNTQINVSNSSWSSLSNTGPTVSVVAGSSGRLKVTVGFESGTASSSFATRMGFIVGNVISADDSRSAVFAGIAQSAQRTFIVTGLNPGQAYTVRAWYRSDSSNNTCRRRLIIAEPF